MHMGLRPIDLTEDRGLVFGWRGGPISATLRIESQLRAGKHANRGGRVLRRHEAARARAEIGCLELVTDLSGTRFDVHQTIVAHRTTPLFNLRGSNAEGRAKFIPAMTSMSDARHMTRFEVIIKTAK